jgi:DNA polymerase
MAKSPLTNVVRYIQGREEDFDESAINVNDNVVHFLMMIFLKSPRAIYLLNKYCNHIYDKFSFREFVDFLRRMSSLLKFTYNDYHYSSLDKEKIRAKYTLFSYLDKVSRLPYSSIEKSFFYTLLRLDIIKLSDIQDDKIEVDKQKIEELLNQLTITDVSGPLDEIVELKKKAKYCIGCPLYGKEYLKVEKEAIYDISGEPDEVEIVFLGINPGREEVKQGKPFVGPAGQKLREEIFKRIPNKKWLITNVIMCPTPNQNVLKNEIGALNFCKYWKDILEKLPNAKIIVTLGEIPFFALFNRKVKITEVSGKKFKYDKYTVIPMPHPSSLLRNSQKVIEAWNRAWDVLTTTNNDTITKNNLAREITSLSEIPKDETLFDIRVLENENKYLIITSTKDGDKKYYLLPFYHKVYVKPNCPPQKCNYLEDVSKLQEVVITDYRELQKLKQYQKKKLQGLIYGNTS